MNAGSRRRPAAEGTAPASRAAACRDDECQAEQGGRGREAGEDGGHAHLGAVGGGVATARHLRDQLGVLHPLIEKGSDER